MCHDADSRPPVLPLDLLPAPMAGGVLEAHELVLVASDGNRLRAFEARPPQPRGGIVIFPDWRGLGQFYEELAMCFAEAGYDAVAFDYFGRTAGTAPHPADFDNLPHVARTTPEGVAADAAAAERLRQSGRCHALAVLGFCFGGRNAILQGLPDSRIAPDARQVPHEIHLYPGATHSFFDQRRAEFAAEAEQAWHRTLAFLDRFLGSGGPV